MSILVKSLVNFNVMVKDLSGITFSPLSTIDLELYFTLDQIFSSEDLVYCINIDYLILLDANGTPLSTPQSLNSLTFGSSITNNYTSGVGVLDFHYTDNANAIDYLECSNTSWTVVTSFIYIGNIIQPVTTVKMVVSRKSESGTAYFRLFDITHNEEICITSWTATNKSIKKISTLNHLPNLESIFEVQVKTTNTTGRARLHYVTLY